MNLKKIVAMVLAMVMMLGLITVGVQADSESPHVAITADGSPMNITVDGVVSYEEWGNPDGNWSYSKNFRGGTDQPEDWTFTGYTGTFKVCGKTTNKTNPVSPWWNQSIKMYARACDDGIYLAFQLIDAIGRDQQQSVANPRKSAGLDFSIGTYNEGDNVVISSNGLERRYSYRVYETYNPDTEEYTTNQLPSYKEPALEKVQVGFDDTTNTYTYEVFVPYDDQYIMEGKDIVLSFALRDKYMSELGSKYANEYYFSTAVGHHFYNLGDSTTRKSPFKDYNPIRLIFPECYVNHTATPMPEQAPAIDGSVTETEWGNPVIVTNRDHARDTWGPDAYLESEPTYYNEEQRAKVWLTNDDNYIYVAATLDKESLGTAWTNSTGYAKTYPQMGLMLAARGETTDLKMNSDNFAIRTEFIFSFDKDGNPVAKVVPKFIARPTTLADSDWSVTFNEETGTYTYEARISYAMTNIEPITSNKIAMSVYLSSSNHDTGSKGENNRYNIGGTGFVTTRYQDECLLMTLNTVVGEESYIGDASAIANNVEIDGAIGETEYGKAYAVVNPTATDIIAFTKIDTTNVRNDQRAKLWVANDTEYIYIAATLNFSERGLVLHKDELEGKGYQYPRLLFSLAQWVDDTTVPVVGDREEFSRYSLTLTDEGMVCRDMGSGVNYTLPNTDYVARFDENTKSYIYEVRIPISATNIDYEKNDYEKNDYMALSAQIGTSTYVESNRNNRYNFKYSASQESMLKPHDAYGAYKIKLYKPDPATFGTYVKDTVEEKKGDISIDANVSSQEWGEPIIVTSPAHAAGTWGEDGYWEREVYDKEQRAKIYATNDKDYLYLAVTLDKAGNSVAAAMEMSPAIGVSLSAWNSATTVQQTQAGGTTKEQFSYFRIGWIDGAPALFVDSSGMDAEKVVLGDEDWALRYDAASKTYTYELRIPFASTNISLHDTTEVAMSLQIGDANGGTSADGENNRYNIGGTGAANQNQADQSDRYPHMGQAMKLNLRQQYYVVDQLSNPNEKIKIDGKINVSEWGQPTIVTNPNHTQETWGSFEANEPSFVDQNQTARVWLTCDESYLYVGATLDKAAAETQYRNRYGATLTSVMRTHFMFDIGRYVEETTVPRSTYKGQVYENYAGFILWMGNDGTQNVKCRSLGMDMWTPDETNYKITYDAATETYTYEIRIPYSWTQIQPYSSDMVFCGSLGTPYMGEGTKANRYHFETGHTGGQKGGDIPHMGHMIKLGMNTPDFGTVNNSVSPFIGDISIDGSIRAGEWGDPMIVTNANHAKKQWGNVWNVDKKTMDPEQTVTIYATNDEENLYFAATVDHTDFDTSDMSAYARAHFFISIGRHDEETGMERIVSQRKTYERFSLLKLYFDAKGQAVFAITNSGMDFLATTDCDYAIAYDEEARTYTYEIRIPLSKTTLRFGNNDQMQVCFTASPAYISGEAATRYNIGGTGTSFGNTKAGNFAHTGKSMTVKLNPNSYTEPVDVYDLSVVNPNYYKDTGRNPNTGDTILIMVAVGTLAVCGLATVCVLRKKENHK